MLSKELFEHQMERESQIQFSNLNPRKHCISNSREFEYTFKSEPKYSREWIGWTSSSTQRIES